MGGGAQRRGWNATEGAPSLPGRLWPCKKSMAVPSACAPGAPDPDIKRGACALRGAGQASKGSPRISKTSMNSEKMVQHVYQVVTIPAKYYRLWNSGEAVSRERDLHGSVQAGRAGFCEGGKRDGLSEVMDSRNSWLLCLCHGL